MQSVNLLKITVDDILANATIRNARCTFNTFILHNFWGDPSLVVGILGETYLRFLSIYDKKNIYLNFFQ